MALEAAIVDSQVNNVRTSVQNPALSESMAIDAAIEDSQVQAAIAKSKEQTHIDV